MSKFNTRDARAAVKGVTVSSEPVINHAGMPAMGRDAKSDLFLLGVTNFVSENTFYEKAEDRDHRFQDLVHEVTQTDPAWVRNFVRWLRQDANMRSASIVAAVEYIRAGGEHGRRVIDSACQRADEPGEVLAYYTTQYGRSIPMPVKRGVADAARRLYNEYSFLKYDSDKHSWRWADVLQVAHVKAATPGQDVLFGYILDSYYRKKDAGLSAEALPVLGKNRDYQEMDRDIARAQLLERPDTLREAGFTWESLSSFGPMDKAAWEAVIPSMGYMALLRNLRNFDEAGVSDEVAARVAARLSDPEQVAKSRQLVFRFYSAYKNAPSLRWGQALETALDLATKNIPVLRGRSLILVDISGSMTWTTVSGKSKVSASEAAALIGAALAKSGQDPDLVTYSNYAERYTFPAGGSVLKATDALLNASGHGGGTNVQAGLEFWDGHDRVIILSDEQNTQRIHPGTVPDNVPVYAFNLAGYDSTMIDSSSNNRYELGGFTDRTFAMMADLESSRNARWPWSE